MNLDSQTGELANPQKNGPIGEAAERVDAKDKVQGKAKYADDYSSGDLLWAAVVRSTIPHGTIEALNITKARNMDGVVEVMTAEDIPGENTVPVIEDDQPALAQEMVRYVGEPVALVAAVDQDTAYRAAQQVEIRYHQRESVTDLRTALDDSSPEIAQEEVSDGHNIFDKMVIDKGDHEQGMKKADCVVEGEYSTGPQEHAYLEPQGMTAVPEREGQIGLLGTMQCPFYVQEAVSAVLGAPLSKVRVEQLATGGAFGGKEDVPSQLAAFVALLAWKIDRPVKLTYDRREDIVATSKRHPAIVHYRTGAKDDGTLTAIEAEVYLDAGAYQTLTPAVLWRSLVHTAGPYRIPNVKITAYSVATNKVPKGAFRGFGSPQVIFPHESQMDRLARKLELDPLQIRIKNSLNTGDETATNQKLGPSVGLQESISRSRELSDWDKRQQQIKSWNENHTRLKKGIGVATVMYGVGMGAKAPFLEKAGSYVKLELDGTLSIAVGNTEMGQGAETVLSQIAGQEMGIELSDIHLLPVDTSRVPDSGPTVASRTTTMAGNAIIDAIQQIKPRIKKVARDMLDADRVVVKESKVLEQGRGNNSISLSQVANELWSRNVNPGAAGWATGEPVTWDPDTGHGDAYFVYSYATHIAEVEIDTMTGESEVTDFVAVHDSGKIVNPTTAAGQVEGGVAQGLGYALTENLKEGDGEFVDPDLTNYLIPTSQDVPDGMTVDFIEAEYPEGPYGAKGLGEVPMMASHAAVANAINNSLEVTIEEYPFSPEKIVLTLAENS